MTGSWRPILEGADAARATAAVEELAGALAGGSAPAADDPFGASLATGEAGLGLAFAYLDRVHPGAGWGGLAGERLSRAIDRLASSFQSPGFFQGFAGIAWTVEHLRDREDADDPNAEVDALLGVRLEQPSRPGDYDLTSGLAGLGIYFLERLAGGAAVDNLARVCDRLVELAVPQRVGVAWPTPAERLAPGERRAYPHGRIDLGVAHGVPGVIAVLARAVASGAAPASTRAVLSQAVGWMLSQKQAAGGESVFPRAFGFGAAPVPGPTAWCYGDPGIAAALLVAARAVGEPAWEAEAIALALAVARRPLEACGIRDAGLCHGAAGAGHIFNRLYQATGNLELLAAARRHLGRALDLGRPGQGVGGFLAWGPDGRGAMGWRNETALLTGAAGVMLALLAATTAVEPAWDRFLLLSPLTPR